MSDFIVKIKIPEETMDLHQKDIEYILDDLNQDLGNIDEKIEITEVEE